MDVPTVGTVGMASILDHMHPFCVQILGPHYLLTIAPVSYSLHNLCV